MSEVDFNPIYPAEHRTKYCPSECTRGVTPQAPPEKPMSAPRELLTLLSPGKLYIWRQILFWILCYELSSSVQWGQWETGLTTAFSNFPDTALLTRTLKQENNKTKTTNSPL